VRQTVRKIREAIRQKGTFEDYITLVVTFRNVTGKDIRAFDGVLMFADLLDNEVLTSHVAIDE
jgi:hypothetical protein